MLDISVTVEGIREARQCGVKLCAILYEGKIFFFSCLMCPTLFRFDTSFVVPVTILAASVWIFLGHPFHTACIYPKFLCHAPKYAY